MMNTSKGNPLRLYFFGNTTKGLWSTNNKGFEPVVGLGSTLITLPTNGIFLTMKCFGMSDGKVNFAN